MCRWCWACAPEMTEPLLRISGLAVGESAPRAGLFRRAGGYRWIDDLVLDVAPGEHIAVLADSDQAARQVAEAIALYVQPLAGNAWFEGRAIDVRRARERQSVRPRLQLLYSDPRRSLPPDDDVAAATMSGEAGLVALGLNPFLLAQPLTSLSLVVRQKLVLARALGFAPRMLVWHAPAAHLSAHVAPRFLAWLADVCRERETALVWTTANRRLAVQHGGRVLRFAGGRLQPL